jgi:hypothetical protein
MPRVVTAQLSDPWFAAKFYGQIDADRSFRHLPSIEGAQGLFLWCPCGYGLPEFPLDGARPHGILVPFRNPRGAPPVPDGHGPIGRDDKTRPRWEMLGDSLENLSLSPSIAVGPAEAECWHGHITLGLIGP